MKEFLNKRKVERSGSLLDKFREKGGETVAEQPEKIELPVVKEDTVRPTRITNTRISAKGKGNRSRRDSDGMPQEKDEEGNPQADESIPPGIEALLFDHERFQKLATSTTKTIHVSPSDPFERLFSEAFLESWKSSDGTYKTIQDTGNYRRIQLPKPRNIQRLLHELAPPRLKSAQPGTPGYDLAHEAWPVCICFPFFYCKMIYILCYLVVLLCAGDSKELLLNTAATIAIG